MLWADQSRLYAAYDATTDGCSFCDLFLCRVPLWRAGVAQIAGVALAHAYRRPNRPRRCDGTTATGGNTRSEQLLAVQYCSEHAKRRNEQMDSVCSVDQCIVADGCGACCVMLAADSVSFHCILAQVLSDIARLPQPSLSCFAFAMSYAYLFKYIIIGDTGVG
jgi:hypothetical protein